MNTTIVRIMVLPVFIALVAAVPFAVSANNGSMMGKSPIKTQTLVQLHADGSALVRGAEVTSVSGGTVTAETSHDGVELRWTVETDSGTELITHNGGDFDLSDIEIGDTVSFSGELTGTFTVDADVLKEWSLQSDTKVAVSGTVKSVDDDDHSFVLSGTRFGDVTVETDGSTTFSGRNNGDFGDLSIGEKIAVSGTYDENNDTIAATRVSLELNARIDDFRTKVKGWFDKTFSWGDWKKH